MEGPRASEGVRFAVETASDPSGAIRRWKILTGRKVVGVPHRFQVPEIIHSAGMLPVHAGSEEEKKALGSLVDEWMIIHGPSSPGIEGALDWVEAVVERAGELSGGYCSEGDVERSIRAYRDRDAMVEALKERCRDVPGFLEPGALRGVIESGRFLPVEAHSILLGRILGEGAQGGDAAEGGGGEDPFLLLARRVFHEREKETGTE